MIDFIVRILTPFFKSLNVSQADLTNYITSLSEYLYVIFGLLLAMIVIIITARWIWKDKAARSAVRWSSAVAFVLAIVVLANAICYGPMYSNISGILNASAIQLSDDVVADSKAVIKETGEEGMVLLENNGILPLGSSTSSINVFGWAQTSPVYGGTGSGGSSSSSNVSILQSLQDAGYETNEKLTKMYLGYCSKRPSTSIQEQNWTLPEPTADYYTADLLEQAKTFSDTAVVVIARTGGEGADLPTDMNSVINGTYNLAETGTIEQTVASNYGYTNGTYENNGDYDDFDEGETYLELSNTEEAMMDIVCSNFDKVIVVINSCSTMELGWVQNYDSLGAVILAPATGATGMSALGEIISGEINPSGKTVDTYVYDLTDTPTFNNIGNYSWSNVDDLKSELAEADSTYEGNISFVDYVEGIYVGYKFYETAADDGVINYDEKVLYPFGYGLSYTTFEQKITSFSQDGENISIEVKVTNTGDVAGKDVVEVYFTPPYTNGSIEKASVNLLDFEKTEMIEPDDTMKVEFSIPLEDLAAYDSEKIKTADGGYILESGDYTISLRSDSHTVIAEKSFSINEDIDYSVDGRTSDDTTATNQFEDVAGNVEYLSRADGFSNYESATAAPVEEDYIMDDLDRNEVIANTVIGYDPTTQNDSSDIMPVTGADKGLMLSDLIGASYDDERWEQLLDQMTIEDMTTLINVGGWQTAKIDSVGKIATSDCDGPAGLNNFVTGNQGTSFPSEVLMAQSWSKEIADKIGNTMGQEYANAENYGWYGPGMNTHRSAFGGRNFEYYSEDGVLAGKFASVQVNSAAKWGVYPYIKHFVLNDQETNRCAILMTYANEQSIREIYLKPFETVIKNFDYDNNALAVMASYNWLGNTPAEASYALLTQVLRNEWGFVGMVESDYDGSYGYMISDACIRAGTDLMLGYGNAESNQFKDINSASCVLAMRKACKNILYTVGNSGYYKDATAVVTTGGMSKMTKIFVTVDIIATILLIGAELLIIFRYRKKKRVPNVIVVETEEKDKD